MDDPIIIDLDGNGFDLTSSQQGVTSISSEMPGDHNSLALRRIGRCVARAGPKRQRPDLYNNCTELFSNIAPQPPHNGKAKGLNQKANGFEALAVFDDHAHGGTGDGVIDERDAVYSQLRLWIDRNHNGVSERSELFKLREKGILSISLKYRQTKWTDAFGDHFRFAGTITTTRGKSHGIYDVVLMYTR